MKFFFCLLDRPEPSSIPIPAEEGAGVDEDACLEVQLYAPYLHPKIKGATNYWCGK